MSTSEQGSKNPRGQDIAHQLYQVSSQLNAQRNIYNSNLRHKLPDKGEKLKKNVEELESLFETLSLQAKSELNRFGGTTDRNCEAPPDSSCDGDIKKYSLEQSNVDLEHGICDDRKKRVIKNEIVTDKKSDLKKDNGARVGHTTCSNSEKLSTKDASRSATNKSAQKEDKNSNLKQKIVSSNKPTTKDDSVPDSSTEENKNLSLKNKILKNSDPLSSESCSSSKNAAPVFGKLAEFDFLSFDKLHKKSATDDTHRDLFDSPSFKTHRQPQGAVPKIQLTDAKPLFECRRINNPQTAFFTSSAASFVSEEAVKKLHSSLSTYPDDAVEETAPVSLKTTLMVHQIKALSWMVWREAQQPSGGVLADDMGLGKTLTMIALILKQKEDRRFLSEKSEFTSRGTLIVCLASIVHQWKEEILKHCKDDSLSVLLYHGPKREKDAKVIRKYDVVLTTYNILLHERKSVKDKNSGLYLLEWERIILDEAHTIKNYRSKTAEAVFSLRSFRRWCVTGTPIHNEIKDMYSLVKFLQLSPFDDSDKWKKLTSDETAGSKERIHLLIKSVLLRRTKTEVDEYGKPIVKMAKKVYHVSFIELSEPERDVYDKLKCTVDAVLNKYFHKSQKKLNTGSTLLVLLLRLQQCCSHVSLLGKEEEEGVDDSLNDLSMCLSTLNIDVSSESSETESNLDITFSEYQNDNLSDRLVKSTKIRYLFEMLGQISEASDNKDKSVIVSQWVSMLDIVAIHLKQDGILYHMISGSTKPEDRQKASDDFNRNEDGCKILLLSLKAGGVGLNLVGGNHLFLLDLHWNPALERQACDRIHRVGQKKNVFIHKFVCKDTIEQRILDLQDEKSKLASNALHGGKVSKSLSMDDFMTLFNVRL